MRSALQRQPPAPTAPVVVAGAKDPTARRRRALRCRVCGREIADPDDRVEQLGAHEHIFVNPHGLDFRVRLYAQAAGARPVGPVTSFYTWFPGYPWRALVCGGCSVHLGWSYGQPLAFVGLIADRMTEEPD